ncbi:GMC family oxidoreductase N-terminal domain-containing protein [Nonomuraea sp. NPDC050556]|uniref:GMC family oxidoreductase N-terminal domain-containing protein n=1 Tax=Nonomuraea sp. NPDC050556 TaxID=3364369 RepID=UPI00379DC0F4
MSLTDVQRDVLRAVVDTVVPSLERDDDPTGFWATPGSALRAEAAIEEVLLQADPVQLAGLQQLLDALAQVGFRHGSLAVRESLLGTVAAMSPEAGVGVATLRAASALFSYSLVDEGGRNPFWTVAGFPGPQAEPTGPIDAPLPVERLTQDMAADAVVVGSGAGGGVIAAELAQAGYRVVMLEAGEYYHEGHFTQQERWATENMLYRGGIASTVDGNAALLAGHTLGGGTTINWQNWIRPRPHVVAEWGLDAEEWDRHIAAVSARVKANADCSDLNGPHQRMTEAAAKLGWSHHRTTRNVDPARYDAKIAGYTQFGDQGASKQGTSATYLRDAVSAGARIMTGAVVTRVLAENGRASGVEVEGGFTVKAPIVVLAAGALETPAILLRSGIGGPAAGLNLRLHPSSGMFGVYTEEQDPWWGPPQSAVVDEFADLGDGYGYLVEGSHYFTGIFAHQFTAQARTGRAHKAAMAELNRTGDFLFVLRERGGGRVALDANGQAEHHYALDDPADVAAFRHALGTLARLHEAAGAVRIRSGARHLRPWERGQDLEAWIAAHGAAPIGAGGIGIGSAHQMGTARMGADPATSVAGPDGQLHDTRGVWIGDTSAFPSASGSNPMLSCMALAHRTAERIAR